ncbi:hypothetical protein AB0I81_44400 [Nonomuraea sp. NPDC050404]|uniref:hypothetical protein n=1 Tax=Nonomuraea sp. NPDC050404 TaxID=3155783 RepID=UPI0033FF11F5
MLKRSRLAFAMSISAAVLCGCGGAAETARTTTDASPVAAAKDKKHQFESAKADCMKQKGFKYVAYVKPEKQLSDQDRKLASGDYEAMRTYREKYGFGIFSRHVYPTEIGIETSHEEVDDDPNVKILRKFSPAQHDAYNKAKDACISAASKQVLGLTVKSNIDYFGQYTLSLRRLRGAELDGDAKLVELAGSMATCLKGKGHPVKDTKPSRMQRRGEDLFMDQQGAIGREQQGDLPKGPKMTKETRQFQMPTLSPQQARPYLDKEIKAALDDLECGKDFYATYEPRDTAIKQRLNEQFASSF